MPPRQVGESDRISWTDPSTGDTFIIDSRTGNSLGQMSSTIGMEDTAPGGGLEDRRTLKLRGSASTTESSDVPTWLSRALDGNTAYAVVEQRLPSLTSATPDQRMCSQKGAGNSPFSVGNESIQSARHISRQQLRHARVIAQVDRKFVACLLTSERSSRSAHSKSVSSCQDTGTTLVLVDQHAADERVRVESFLKPLCLGFLYSRSGGMNPEEATPITRLIPPRRALLTRHEASLLKRNAGIRELFRCWGISFMEMPENDIGSSVDVGSSDDYVQILVTSLPEVLADKLRRDNELQAVLKSTLGEIEFGTLSADMTSLPSSQLGDTLHDWLPALRCCPQSLVELINSKACRGAVMFNDELTKEQCERLVSQLAQTTFPFQCAHGRFVSRCPF
ncbi:hypothetical protein DFP72DRAFT_802844 [Ephemerocybe angulata]|uniref:MutL C-terminal dimerisation domain-containing protein n=1 Tax=Ephemerocybe angulata TaxID=980116 RepID=A0A8H6MDV0_9AGAR|nr:hypothetical protein DFP72DRAFT_802844 [Tulosesus angulatus]